MIVYVVDSNFFIDAHRANYPLDIAFSFWNKIKELATAGTLISIDKVKAEIYDKNDALEDWCKTNLPNDFFKPTNEIIDEYGQVSTWAISRQQHYLPNVLNEFLDADEADAFMVAYALNDKVNRIIVTQEISQPERKNKIKIPEACNHFNVRYLKTMEMLREQKVTF